MSSSVFRRIKYVVKEKNIFNYSPDDINVSYDDSDRESSDYSDEKDSNK